MACRASEIRFGDRRGEPLGETRPYWLADRLRNLKKLEFKNSLRIAAEEQGFAGRVQVKCIKAVQRLLRHDHG